MKITIVSFLPWAIRETKPGVIPCDYDIEASDTRVPTTLVIDDASTNIYMGADRGTFPSPVPVEQLANSIINDHVSANIDIDTDAKPALFWVPGALSPLEVMKQHPQKCKEALDKQRKWAMILIKKADDAWARYRQHRMVTDPQRKFAVLFGFTKEWAVAPEPVTLEKCPACTTLIESTALICKNCRTVVKPEEYKKLNLTAAPVSPTVAP